MAGKSSKLLPAYLLVGEDQLKKERALSRMISRLDPASADFNMETIDFSIEQADIDHLDTSLQTLPFMADFRLIILKSVDKALKETTERLVTYLKAPNEGVVVLMTADKLAKNTRLYKAFLKGESAGLGSGSIIECTPKKRWELPPQVRSMAPSHGVTITSDAAEHLVALVGESSVMLDTTLAKLAESVGAGYEIKRSDVDKMVERTAEVKPWDFLDAVSNRNPGEAMKLFNMMPSQNMFGLFSLSVTRVRELVAARALVDRGIPGALATELSQPAWRLKNHTNWAKKYSAVELRHALMSAAECDVAMKSTSDKESAFITWILGWCTKNK